MLPCICAGEKRSQRFKQVGFTSSSNFLSTPQQPDASVVPDHSREAETDHTHNRSCVRTVQDGDSWIPFPAASVFVWGKKKSTSPKTTGKNIPRRSCALSTLIAHHSGRIF